MRRLDRRLWAGLLVIGAAWSLAALDFAQRWLRDDRSPAWRAPRDYTGAVEIAGAVRRPGVRAGLAGLSLGEALALSGPRVAPAAAGLDRPLEEGDRIVLLTDGRVARERMPGRRLLALDLPIRLDRAAPADLEALPGVGPVLAGRIIAYRDAHAPLRSIAQLDEVPGVGPKTLSRIRPHLRLAGD